MEKVYSKEEILELSEATIDVVKLKRNRNIFSMIAILAAISGSVYAARMLGVDQSMVNQIASYGMIANGVTATWFVPDIIKKSMVIKPIQKSIEDIRNTEESDEDYYSSLKELWDFLKIKSEEVHEYREKKGKTL